MATITATAPIITPAPVVSVTITPTSTVPPRLDKSFNLKVPMTRRNLISPFILISPGQTRQPPNIYGFTTSTATKTNTVTACPSTRKSTSTATGTITATNRHAPVTSTTTSTSVISSTSTTTTIVTIASNNPSTITITVAATTVYAACATDNLLTFDLVESAYVGLNYERNDKYTTIAVPSSYSHAKPTAIAEAPSTTPTLASAPSIIQARTRSIRIITGIVTMGMTLVIPSLASLVGGLVFYVDEEESMGVAITAGPCGQGTESYHWVPGYVYGDP
ncbi:MAG: hypothetical protein Q9170_006752 [Blastenia crenularia]